MSVEVAVLETIPLFAGLPGEDRVRVAELADEISVPAGAPISRERDFAYHFYAIVEGGADQTFRRLEAEIAHFAVQVRAALGERGSSVAH